MGAGTTRPAPVSRSSPRPLPVSELHLHVQLGRRGERLVHHAIALSSGDQLIELVSRHSRAKVEYQTDLEKTNRRVTVNPERPAEVQVPLGSHDAGDLDAAV